MTSNPELDKATAAQVLWTPGRVLASAVEWVKAGLRERERGRSFFGPDNIPNEFDHGGSGISGTVQSMLIDAHLITPCNIDNKDWGIRHGRRKSVRYKAKSRWVNLYHLTSVGLAESFVAKHDRDWQRSQRDWIDEVRQTGKVDGVVSLTDEKGGRL